MKLSRSKKIPEVMVFVPDRRCYQRCIKLFVSLLEFSNFPFVIGQYSRYTALQQHHSSPTGEHVLFEQSSRGNMSSSGLPCALSPHDPLLASRMGKFGAPANPARSN
ncbi:hypothetical protein Y032_0006g3076 [Ancylostoma ceylanicum]|uniref:Uncharacterized protein n=1 Tax=Ancylostoma ceylanicum TaxID=53326 RepID=A0A016VQN4_9BILA|nr:hypothetical protein Y032_0006g3076 [Ancylostoma ceylanicum]